MPGIFKDITVKIHTEGKCSSSTSTLAVEANFVGINYSL